MRLSNALKEELMSSVIADQFRDEFKDLEEEFKAVFKKELVANYSQLDQELRALAEKHKVPKTVLCNNEGQVRIDVPDHKQKYADTVRRYPFVKQNRYSSTNLCFAFTREVYPGIYVPPTTAWHDVSIAVQKCPKTEKVLLKQGKWATETSKVIDDLASILRAVTTDKALKELTTVFTPFLPITSAGKALIPAEAILRVNELKSPKNGKKKA